MIKDFKHPWSFYVNNIAYLWWRCGHAKNRKWARRWKALADYRIDTGQPRYRKENAE